MRGKGFRTMHVVGDFLWAAGDQSMAPVSTERGREEEREKEKKKKEEEEKEEEESEDGEQQGRMGGG